MSGIFGLFNKDDAPVDPALLAVMRAAMAYWGPDGGGTWHGGPCGLGQLLLYNTPEALYERMPHAVDGGRLVITAEARLDNRDELCDRFAVASAERPTMSDGDLILRAYQHWGVTSPEHLYGDWSFAAWQPDERRLFLARDHLGTTALYYVDTPRFFAFASSKKALLALPQVAPRLNELKFAQHMLIWEGNPEHTPFEGIHHLLPAHTLTITPQRCAKRRYWYLEDAPEVCLPSTEAYAEELRDMLERVVRHYLRSHRDVGLALSSGLDSSGLAALAAPLLGARGRPLFAYTAIPIQGELAPVAPRVADESPWVRATVQYVGNIRDHYLDCAQTSPVIAAGQMLEILDAPIVAWANSHWLLGIADLARKQGVGVLLNGHLGNATASWRGLLRAPAWSMFLRYGRWHAGLRDLVWPLLPAAAARRINAWRSARQVGWLRAFLRPEFAQRVQLAERLATGDHGFPSWRYPHERLPAREQRLAIIRPSGCWTLGAIYAEAAAYYGLEKRSPLADPRLAAYCLGIPDRYFFHHGVARGLYRQALTGRLPEGVVWNERRGIQGADLVARLRRHRADVEQAMAGVLTSPAVQSVLDVTQLRRAWARVRVAGEVSAEVGHTARQFMHGLAMSIFLRRLTEGENSIADQ